MSSSGGAHLRIVSTAPSATEVVCALGLAEALVGVSYHCDYPPAVRGKPVVVESLLPRGLSQRAIDSLVREARRRGESLFRVRVDLLRELQPDLVIYQGGCDVCSVQGEQVSSSLGPLVLSYRSLALRAEDVEGILEDIMSVGRATGRVDEARRLVDRLRHRIREMGRLIPSRRRPRVLLLEWLDPPMVGGHWAPELVRLAGGIPLLAAQGLPSFTIGWREVVDCQPDILVLAPCGFSVPETLREMAGNPPPEEWWGIPAVREGRVWVVDANAYFSRPGPRFIHGLEILLELLWDRRVYSDDAGLKPYAQAEPWL